VVTNSNMNRRRFFGRLGIGVGGTVLGIALLYRILKGNGRGEKSGSREYHVSHTGDDSYPGSISQPFETITRAAEVSRAGDTVTVHQGVYRERINPPRGGTGKNKRIIYQAAEGEKVIIKGSEVLKGWEHLQKDTWQVIIPNSFFGAYNPFSTLISGDWFNSKEREHHTGAVYLNGHWLSEAAKQEELTET